MKDPTGPPFGIVLNGHSLVSVIPPPFLLDHSLLLSLSPLLSLIFSISSSLHLPSPFIPHCALTAALCPERRSETGSARNRQQVLGSHLLPRHTSAEEEGGGSCEKEQTRRDVGHWRWGERCGDDQRYNKHLIPCTTFPVCLPSFPTFLLLLPHPSSLRLPSFFSSFPLLPSLPSSLYPLPSLPSFLYPLPSLSLLSCSHWYWNQWSGRTAGRVGQ